MDKTQQQEYFTDINQLRRNAERLYGGCDDASAEEAINHQSIILSVIAEQLVHHNALLERIAFHLENGQIAVLTNPMG